MASLIFAPILVTAFQAAPDSPLFVAISTSAPSRRGPEELYTLSMPVVQCQHEF